MAIFAQRMCGWSPDQSQDMSRSSVMQCFFVWARLPLSTPKNQPSGTAKWKNLDTPHKAQTRGFKESPQHPSAQTRNAKTTLCKIPFAHEPSRNPSCSQVLSRKRSNSVGKCGSVRISSTTTFLWNLMLPRPHQTLHNPHASSDYVVVSCSFLWRLTHVDTIPQGIPTMKSSWRAFNLFIQRIQSNLWICTLGKDAGIWTHLLESPVTPGNAGMEAMAVVAQVRN